MGSPLLIFTELLLWYVPFGFVEEDDEEVEEYVVVVGPEEYVDVVVVGPEEYVDVVLMGLDSIVLAPLEALDMDDVGDHVLGSPPTILLLLLVEDEKARDMGDELPGTLFS